MTPSHPFAAIFPGQGSQSVGMLDAWGAHPVVQQTLAEASAALGYDVGTLIAQGPKETLAQTVHTQPVMLVAGIAAYRVWAAETGWVPALVAGHSLGEYTALVAAGVLSLDQALPLVRFRAQCMQEAVPAGQGAMAAILGLPAEHVVRTCADIQRSLGGQASTANEVVEAVNFNDPLQTVIAGSQAAVEQACTLLKEQGAKRALLLPVSAPFHSSLMRPAAEKLKERLAQVAFAAPTIPVLNNVDVAMETEPDRIRDALYRQAFGPVRWVELVQAMQPHGVRTALEFGPGKVLTGMNKRIDAHLAALPVFDSASLGEARLTLQGSLQELEHHG